VRAYIQRGLFYGGYEPHDMPGAYIVTRHAVRDAQGIVPPEQIAWDGPAEWIESRDGVPAGFNALWLGSRQATRPFVVFVQQAQTRESDRFDRAYRRGWKAKRRPTIGQGATEDEVEGTRSGWKDSPNNRGGGR
jgi:hypothetical protein